jgi:hypothetical protein
MDLRRQVVDGLPEQETGLTREQGRGKMTPSTGQEDFMARSKYVTNGIVASVIWLIIGSVGLFFRNSSEAREANALARGSCRGEEDFRGCLDAYYASVGGSPGIDWGRIALVLLAGLVVIWVITFALKALKGNKAEE